MYSENQNVIVTENLIRADSKKIRVDSILARLKSFNDILIRADSKVSKPTHLECSFENSLFEPTQMEKSQLN